MFNKDCHRAIWRLCRGGAALETSNHSSVNQICMQIRKNAFHHAFTAKSTLLRYINAAQWGIISSFCLVLILISALLHLHPPPHTHTRTRMHTHLHPKSYVDADVERVDHVDWSAQTKFHTTVNKSSCLLNFNICHFINLMAQFVSSPKMLPGGMIMSQRYPS